MTLHVESPGEATVGIPSVGDPVKGLLDTRPVKTRHRVGLDGEGTVTHGSENDSQPLCKNGCDFSVIRR